jgi:hypothetical protein
MIKNLIKKLPSLTIAPRGIKYLTRYYTLLKDRDLFNIYIHQFHSSDLDTGVKGFGLLHNHPFKWSFSFIVDGSYAEERLLKNGNIIVRVLKPGMFNFISREDFHRVDLLTDTVWTVFFTGPRIKNEDSNWGFWDRVTRKYKDFRDFPDAIE